MAKRNKKQIKKPPAAKRNGNSLAAWFFVSFFMIIIPLLHFKTIIDPVLYPRFLALAAGLITLSIILWSSKWKVVYFEDLIRNRFFQIYLAFILITGVAMIFAINPVEGLTDLLKWIIAGWLIFFGTAVFSKDKTSIDLLLKAVIISTVIAVITGVYQFANFVIGSNDPDAIYAVKGLMAHKNQYAIALFLWLPFLSSAILRLHGPWKKAASMVLILDLLMILLVQTRSVWIALFACVLFSTLLVLVVFRKHLVLRIVRKRLNRFFVGAVILAVLGIGVLIFAPSDGPLGSIKTRITSVFDLTQTSNSWRLEMWYATADLAKDHPLTGVGGGNWILAIYPYYGKYLPSVFRQWRHPHNDFLGMAAEKGIPALILYLSLFGYLFYRTIRKLIVVDDSRKWWMLFWMMNGLAGFLVISFFSFPAERINQVILVSIIAALLLAETERNEKNHVHATNSLNKWIWAIPFLMLGFAIYFGVLSVQMEYYIAKAQKAKDRGQWTQLQINANKGYHPLAPIESRYSFPSITYKAMAAFYGSKDFKRALKYFKEAERQHPTNISLINNIGSTFGQMAEFDSCLVYYQKSLAIFPRYHHALFSMAKACYLKGDYPKAYKYLLACDPQSDDAKFDLLRKKLVEHLDSGR